MKRYFTISGQNYSSFSSVLLLFIVFLMTSPVSSQDQVVLVESIVLSGESESVAPDIFDLTGIRLPADLQHTSIVQIVDRLQQYYTDRGFLFFEIGSISLSQGVREGASVLTIAVNEGRQCLFDEVILTGAGVVPADIKERYMPRRGTVFSVAELRASASGIAEFYNETGYPYHIVRIKDMEYISRDFDNEIGVKVTLEVQANEKTQIDSLHITGNEYTKDHVIARESRLKKGELYRERNIEKARDFIRNLPYIDRVNNLDLVTGSEGEQLVRINVKEKNPNRFDGLIGYIPSGSEEKGYYIGSFHLGLGNIFGTGRRLTADWKRPDRYSQDLYLSYAEPWIFGLPADISGEIAQVVQDSSFVRRRFSLGADIRLRDRFSAHLTLGVETIIPDDANGALLGIDGSDSRRYAVGISYDNMDDIYNPRNGILYSTSITHQLRSSDTVDTDDVRDRIINARFEAAKSITGGFVTFIRTAWDQTFSSEDQIPISQHWYLGGADNLRGYSEKQFRASTITWYNFELRYMLGSSSRIFVFQDGGFFSNKGEDVSRKFGYGFGMRVQSGIGLVGFDFGLGDGDSFSAAKVHVKLQTTF